MRTRSIVGIVLAAVLGVVLIVGGIIAMAFWATSGVTEAGDRFLSLLGQGKSQEAYREHTTAALRQQDSEESFTQAVKRLGLTDWASSSWTARKVENSVGTLEGTVKTRSGGTIPLKMQLVKENGQWKVGLCAPAGSGVASPPKPSLPPVGELNKLATQSLLNFSQAAQAKDFGAFHATLAGPFQRTKTPEELLTIFRSFVDQGINLAGIAEMTPVFDPAPSINEDGLLRLQGRYPTRPSQVIFDMKYIQENGIWRLMGINVKVKPEE